MEHEFEQEFRMLGLKIAYYRKVKNLTQEQLAEKLGDKHILYRFD